MISQVCNTPPRKILLVLACIAVATGCASSERQSKPATVPEIHPGILAGYLQPEELPNSLALLPSPPAEGSAAHSLDEEVSRNNLVLRGTPRWELAAKAELAAVCSKGLKPTGDCQAESNALAHHPPLAP